MKKIPEDLLQSLEGTKGFDRKTFEEVHAAGKALTSVRLNPAKILHLDREWSIVNLESSIDRANNSNDKNRAEQKTSSFHHSRFTIDDPVPWSRYGFYLTQRPSFTFDPLFHAGCYYVQEASSMFLEQAFLQLTDLSKPLKVLDLCGAPGGKSTHIQSLISNESLLVSNEAIKNRSHVLIDNIVKWGAGNVVVTNNDPSVFQKLEGFFDVIVTDAPCSGSGLFRRDEEAIDEWSLNNVQLCSQRQKRILADALPVLKQNGLLMYSTCSYSKEEDEEIADWLVKEFEMESLALHLEEDWNIVTTHAAETGAEGYRFYPDKLRGEGFFLACFRKTNETRASKSRPAKIDKATARERSIIEPWLRTKEIGLCRYDDRFFAIQEALMDQYAIIRPVLNVRYAGVAIGQVMKEKLVPEHGLAMSNIVSSQPASNELNIEQAIRYLQRQDFNFNSSGKGWQLVCYKGHNLGWINVLPNRINNYYPKELRILKSTDGRYFEK